MSSTSLTGGVGFAGALFSWRICASCDRARHGFTSYCFATPPAGNRPSWRSRLALPLTAPTARCSRLAICAAEAVGHSRTSSPISSLVQSLMMAIQRVESGLI